jgi:lipoprotein-anchoring transpeptidase ErfK/SrfK
MKKQFGFLIVLWLLWAMAPTIASNLRVVINLSGQQAYLVQDNKVILTSPISSGRTGWSTPRGNFHVISKDIDHRSRSFGAVVDATGRVVNSNATPANRVPAGGHFRCAPMPFYMEFSPAVGMHGGYLPGYPASHGCVRMPRDMAALFFERVQIGTPVTVTGSTSELTHVRRALPVVSRSP